MAEHSLRDEIEGKVCTKCGEWKPLGEFYNNKSMGDGLTVACKECCRERGRRKPQKCVDCGTEIYKGSVRCKSCAILYRHQGRFVEKNNVEGKFCSQCGEWKPLDGFYALPKASDGRVSACKDCTRTGRRNRRELCVDCGTPVNYSARRCLSCEGLHRGDMNREQRYAVKDGIEGKVCTRCEDWKRLTEYARRSRNGDGLSCHCKDCRSELRRQYRLGHAEMINQRSRRYYQENRETILREKQLYRDTNREAVRAYHRQWVEENKERYREKIREYYLRNKQKIKRRVLEWQKAHPEKKREQAMRRRARKAGCVVKAVDIQAIYERDGNCCVYCGRAEDPTIDHVEPLAKGGAHHRDNLVVACKKCNSEKNTKWLGVGEDHWLPWEWHGPFPYEEIQQRAVAL